MYTLIYFSFPDISLFLNLEKSYNLPSIISNDGTINISHFLKYFKEIQNLKNNLIENNDTEKIYSVSPNSLLFINIDDNELETEV